MSIARHRTMAMTLPSKARLVLLRFVISISSYFLRVRRWPTALWGMRGVRILTSGLRPSSERHSL